MNTFHVGFTPDVKVWEVCFTRTGDYQEVRRAFELKGHSAGVYSFAFSQGSDRYVFYLFYTCLIIEF